MNMALKYVIAFLLLVTPNGLSASEVAGNNDISRNGSLTASIPNQKDYDYGIYLITSFFPSLANKECSNAAQRTNRNCIDLADDGLDLQKIADAFPTRSVLNRNVLKSHLPVMREIFDCIANKCDRYKFISDEDLDLVINEGDQALNYLLCLATIHPNKFWDQAIEAIKHYHSLPTVISFLEHWKQIPLRDELAHLFIQNTTFSECSYFKISDRALNLLRNIQPRKTIKHRF